MVKPMHEQSPSVKLLTILNVQSAKPPPSSNKKRSSSSSSSSTSTTESTTGQKKEIKTRDWHSIAKKAKKVKLAPSIPPPASTEEPTVDDDKEDEEPAVVVEGEDNEEDSFKLHFGSNSKLVDSITTSDEETVWNKKRTLVKGFGECIEFKPSLGEEEENQVKDGLDLVRPSLSRSSHVVV
jgi:hypothetical protein